MVVGILAIFFLWAGVWPETIRQHRCEVIERNTVYDDEGRAQLSQYIFWCITDRGTWYVRDWRMIKPGMARPHKRPGGGVELVFWDRRRWLRIVASTYFETDTLVDREIENRKLLPIRLRRRFH